MDADRTDIAERQGLDQEIVGLDALDVPRIERVETARRVWAAAWPKLAALAGLLALWQLVVWTGWRPVYVLPGPGRVLRELAELAGTTLFWSAAATTLRRAAAGFALAVAIGTLVGVAVWGSRHVRRALGSFITGLQSMPSIAWFPFAILLFGLSESAILFVVVLGAAPSIANGLISGVDQIPVLLLRAGRVLGARGLGSLRHVILPAALPGYVAGLKQGWAFAWRSLMAGELLVIILGKASIGVQMQTARDLADSPGLLSSMVVILALGIVIDAAVFSTADRALRRRHGLVDPGAH
jgi:NitT/TauT family transport system permease protein